MKIENKVFLITGGSSGIGKETAKKLIRLGGKVAITGLNEIKLNKVAQEIGALPIHADVSNDSDIDRTFKTMMSSFGQLDVLINNAGFGKHQPIEKLTRADFEQMFQVNVFGMAMMSQKAAEIFKQNQSGTIINIGSTSALNGYKTGAGYSSSKFAVRGLTQCLQAELRPHNIRVMLINPSEVTTAFGSIERTERSTEPKKLGTEEIAHTIISVLTMEDKGMIPELNIWATNPW